LFGRFYGRCNGGVRRQLFQSGFHCINCQLHRIDCCCEAFNQALVLAFCVFAIEADKFGCFVPIGVPVSTLSESLSFFLSRHVEVKEVHVAP
jgi:hypothetical protein